MVFGYATEARGQLILHVKARIGRQDCFLVAITQFLKTKAAEIACDGSSWTQVGSAQMMTMSTNAWIGLAIGSKNNTMLNTSTFDNVTITPAP